MNKVHTVFCHEVGEGSYLLGMFEGTPEGLQKAEEMISNYQTKKFYSEDYYTLETFDLPFVRKRYPEGHEGVTSKVYDKDNWTED